MGPEALRRLPAILTQDKAVRLIDSASDLFHRAMLTTVYSTAMRRAEMCQLKLEDIDSDRMLMKHSSAYKRAQIGGIGRVFAALTFPKFQPSLLDSRI
jgi:integrase